MPSVFKLPELPFSPPEMEGFISSETLKFHHGKHHASYVKKANELLPNGWTDLSTGEIIRQADITLKNQVSQVWNHAFYWRSLAPEASVELETSSDLHGLIDRSFENFEGLKKEFVEKGSKHFASGWLFLAYHPKDGRLTWEELHDAGSPFDHSWIPLLCADLWEHAYYIDYRNDRAQFLKRNLDFLNWDFAEQNLQRSEAAELDEDIREISLAAQAS